MKKLLKDIVSDMAKASWDWLQSDEDAPVWIAGGYGAYSFDVYNLHGCKKGTMGYNCTKTKGHLGNHAAHTMDGYKIYEWSK